jgi:hypothetical protein
VAVPVTGHLIVMLIVVGAMALLLGWSAFIIVGIVRWDRDPFPPDRARHDPGPQARREDQAQPSFPYPAAACPAHLACGPKASLPLWQVP